MITFEKNPKRLLSPEGFRGDISTLDQKLSLLESAGVDLCVLIDFSGDFSKLPGRQFLSMLHDSGDLRYLAVGGDFRCGHRLDTDAEGVRQFLRGLARSSWSRSAPCIGRGIQSARAGYRKAVVAGHLEDAAQMLGQTVRGRPPGMRLALGLGGDSLRSGGQASPPPGPYESRTLVRGRELIGRAAADEGARSPGDGRR